LGLRIQAVRIQEPRHYFQISRRISRFGFFVASVWLLSGTCETLRYRVLKRVRKEGRRVSNNFKPP